MMTTLTKKPYHLTAEEKGPYDHAATSLVMAKLWPALFTPGNPKPLAVRLNSHLCRDLVKQAHTENVRIHRFLEAWTASQEYLQALVEGGPRYAIDGTPMGRVTEGQQMSAKKRLNDLLAKEACATSTQA